MSGCQDAKMPEFTIKCRMSGSQDVRKQGCQYVRCKEVIRPGIQDVRVPDCQDAKSQDARMSKCKGAKMPGYQQG
jgi:hypothetical protein